MHNESKTFLFKFKNKKQCDTNIFLLNNKYTYIYVGIYEKKVYYFNVASTKANKNRFLSSSKVDRSHAYISNFLVYKHICIYIKCFFCSFTTNINYTVGLSNQSMTKAFTCT